MEQQQVDKSAMRRLIHATDIQAHALKSGKMKRFHMARHAETILSPEVDREITAEMIGNLREAFTAISR